MINLRDFSATYMTGVRVEEHSPVDIFDAMPPRCQTHYCLRCGHAYFMLFKTPQFRCVQCGQHHTLEINNE